MIVTTTTSVENRTITSYEGIVFGEVITGINVLKDIGAGLRNVFGGRSKGYEDELVESLERNGRPCQKTRLRCGCRCEDGL